MTFEGLREERDKDKHIKDNFIVDYILVIRLSEYKNISAYDRALYGIYAGKDIMQSEVAVVKFDLLTTDRFKNL